jgi:hypothetical protein
MSNLLIHSMTEFAEIILVAIQMSGASHIVEIGAEFGGMSVLLSDHVRTRGGRLTSVDPAPKPEFLDWAASEPHVTHIAKPSLEAFDDLAQVDAWVVDGDHNWFTVFHELKAIEAASLRDGKPMLAFLHDVAWPSGRRDMYYAPQQIPSQYRHGYDFESGAFPGRDQLVWGRGFRGDGAFAWAKHEGGPRNGVRTAIDDFIVEAGAGGRDYAYAEVPAVFGLGVIFSVDAPWSGDVAQLLMPYHKNRLLAKLEENRLANYMQVLEWQAAHS